MIILAQSILLCRIVVMEIKLREIAIKVTLSKELSSFKQIPIALTGRKFNIFILPIKNRDKASNFSCIVSIIS